MAKFLDSNKVKVFPTAFRGKDGSGNAVNPEAFMTTEGNLVNITNKVTYNRKDYFFLDGSTVHIIIVGYYFVASKSDITALFSNPSTNDEIHACISVSNLATSYSSVSVPTLTPNGGSAGDILDVTDVTQQFKGLSFEGKDDTTGLKLFKYDGSSWNPIISSMLNIDVSQVGWGNSPISSHFLTSDLVGVDTGVTNLYGYSGPINLYSDIIPQHPSGSLPVFNLGSYDNFFSGIYGRAFVLNDYRSNCHIVDVLHWEPYNSNYDLGYLVLEHLESGVESSPGGTLNLVNFGLNMNSGSIYGVSSIFASSMYASDLYASNISVSGQTMFVSVKNATLKTSSDIYMDASKQISLYASGLGLYASSNVSGTIYGNISIYANKNIDIIAQFSSGNTHYGTLLLSAYSTVELRTGDQTSGGIYLNAPVYASNIRHLNDFDLRVFDVSDNTIASYKVDSATGTSIYAIKGSLTISASAGMLSLYAGSSITLSASYSMNLLAGYSIHLSTGSSIYLDTKTSKIHLGNTGMGGAKNPVYISTTGKITACDIGIYASKAQITTADAGYIAVATSGFTYSTNPIQITTWSAFNNTFFTTLTQLNSIFTLNFNCYQSPAGNVGAWLRIDLEYMLKQLGRETNDFNYNYFTCQALPRMEGNGGGATYYPFMNYMHDTGLSYRRFLYLFLSCSDNIYDKNYGFCATVTLAHNSSRWGC